MTALEKIAKGIMDFSDNKIFGLTKRDIDPRTSFYTAEEADKARRAGRAYSVLVLPLFATAGASVLGTFSYAFDSFQNSMIAIGCYSNKMIELANTFLFNAEISAGKTAICMGLAAASFKIAGYALSTADILKKKTRDYDLDQEVVEELNSLKDKK